MLGSRRKKWIEEFMNKQISLPIEDIPDPEENDLDLLDEEFSEVLDDDEYQNYLNFMKEEKNDKNNTAGTAGPTVQQRTNFRVPLFL